MKNEDYLSTLNLDSETVITQLDEQLSSRGVRVVRSFDLQSACASFPDQTCPHHRDTPCDCQLVVLLVYGAEGTPASLVLHSHRGVTDIDLVDSPGHRPDKELVEVIRASFRAIVHPALFHSEREGSR